MKIGSITLSGGKMSSISAPRKTRVLEHLYADTCTVEDQGRGARTFTVTCYTSGTTERDALEAELQAAGEKKVYFPSTTGASDDRYYRCKVTSYAVHPHTAALIWNFSIGLVTLDQLTYDATTETALW